MSFFGLSMPSPGYGIMGFMVARPAGDCPSKMNVIIGLGDDKKPEIGALCQRFGTRSLDFFGSVATGAFDPNRSDLDFIVNLGE